MVLLEQVHISNEQIATALDPNLVAVFVGATSGIGEYTLKAFAKHAKRPRVYFVGRSEEAGNRIKAECETLNTEGEFTFIKSDIGLLRNVDDVCRRIKERESKINLLVLSQGTLVFNTETGEGLHLAAALVHHSRFRFTLNFLPLLQAATGLRRVVSIFIGAKEGPLDPTVDVSDVEGRNIALMKRRGHAASAHTLGLESLAKKAPEVGFVHVFPGHVKSGIARGTTGILMGILKVVSEITGPFLRMDVEECGERHLFLCTSQRYCSSSRNDGNGVKMVTGVETAKGTDGEVGSGVYSVDEYGESGNKSSQDALAELRAQGVGEKQWEATVKDFKRICEAEKI